KVLNAVAVGVLGFGIIYIFYRVWRIQNRQVNFRNDQPYFTIPMLLRWRKFRQRTRLQKAYEHNPEKLPAKLVDSLKRSLVLPADMLEKALNYNGAGDSEFSTSVAFLVPTLMDGDKVMTDLAIRFLDGDCLVQYTTCSRHPIEFLIQLKHEWLKQH